MPVQWSDHWMGYNLSVHRAAGHRDVHWMHIMENSGFVSLDGSDGTAPPPQAMSPRGLLYTIPTPWGYKNVAVMVYTIFALLILECEMFF